MKKWLIFLLLLVASRLDAALPVYRGESTFTAQIANITPADPAGVTIGDLDIMVATTDIASTISITANGGTAWTAFSGSPVNGTTSTGEKLYVWWRIFASGDGVPSLTASADHATGYRFAIQTGTFDDTSPIEITNTGSEDTSDTSYSYAPGTTTLGPDRLVFAVASSQFDAGGLQVTAAANASLANIANTTYNNTALGGGGGSNVCRGELATASSVGTFTATWTQATKKNYLSFAVKPVAGAVTNQGAFFQFF